MATRARSTVEQAFSKMLEDMTVEELEAMISDDLDPERAALIASLPDYDLEMAARHGIITPLAREVLGYED